MRVTLIIKLIVTAYFSPQLHGTGSIGRFFTTIVGFVEARRMVIAEGTEAISEAVKPRDEEKVVV